MVSYSAGKVDKLNLNYLPIAFKPNGSDEVSMAIRLSVAYTTLRVYRTLRSLA